MENNYSQLVEYISRNSGLPVDEIERKIEAKQAKLSGLISKEGAAQVIAAELKINFSKQVIQIAHIVPGMRKINLIGKIVSLYPVREYNKNGRAGRVANFVLADETSNVRTVLWDENHINLIGGEIKEGSVVEINNASVRNGEIHLSNFSEIKVSDKDIENPVMERPVSRKHISDFNSNDNISVRAFIVQMFEPRFFEVCPECRKKVTNNECVEHGKVIGDKRALLNFVIDDGSDSIRSVMFSDEIKKIMSDDDINNRDRFALKKNDLLGKEVILSGQVRKNTLYNNNEVIVSDLEEINIDKLINELEK